MLKRKREDKRREQYLLIVALLLVVVLLPGLTIMTLVVSRAAVSPDPTLLYNSNGYQHSVNLTTGDDRVIGVSDGYSNRHATSPDGHWYAEWAPGDAPNAMLRLTDTATNESREFGPYEVAYVTLSWSPDSQWIAFGAGNKKVGLMEGTELFLLNIDNGALKQLTDNSYRDDSPAFSPDGTRLAFTSSEDGYNRLYVMDLTTHERRKLTPGNFGYSPAWSPDGRLIAYMSNMQEFNGDIYVIGADGRGERRITNTNATDDMPRWK